MAALLADEKVVGWFEGRMEFGPRALGARSILGDPRSPRMQSVMNLKIKFRESFRPFAPAVLAERAADYFEIDRPSPYMLLVAPVRAELLIHEPRERNLFGIARLNVPRSSIPAVTHVDYSARVQTVHRETNPRFYGLLKHFDALTGCAALVNTSFNVRGEPMVCSPRTLSAVSCGPKWTTWCSRISFWPRLINRCPEQTTLGKRNSTRLIADAHESRTALGNKQLRDFGLITGAVFALLFGLFFPWLRSHSFPVWPWIFCAALSGPALLRPQALRYPYLGWTRLGLVLGSINSRIMLTVIFFLVIVPMGIALRLCGRDPMARRFNREAATYRVPSRQAPLRSMERPFECSICSRTYGAL